MKNILQGVLAASVIAAATPVVAQEIIVVSHGQANDPFWRPSIAFAVSE